MFASVASTYVVLSVRGIRGKKETDVDVYKAQGVMISTWYTNSMSDCQSWSVQLQLQTINLLNVENLHHFKIYIFGFRTNYIQNNSKIPLKNWHQCTPFFFLDITINVYGKFFSTSLLTPKMDHNKLQVACSDN